MQSRKKVQNINQGAPKLSDEDFRLQYEELTKEAEGHSSTQALYNFLYNKSALTATESDDFEKHLLECDRCREEFETLKLTYGGR